MRSTQKFYLMIVLAVLITVPLWYTVFALLSKMPLDIAYELEAIKYLLSNVTSNELANKAFISLGVAVSPVIVLLALKHSHTHKNRFGDAEWATAKNIRDYGYLGYEGVIIGQTKLGKLLISHGPKTVGLASRPRSGKGVSCVIPNMLNWAGSAVVIDVKKEIFEITSGYREKHGQTIYVFDPLGADKKSHCINIFDGIDRSRETLSSEVQKIAHSLMPDGKEKFWDEGGRSIFIGIALYLLETNKHCSIPEILAFTEGSTNLQDKMFNIIDSEESNDMSPYAVSLLREYAEMESDSKLVPGYLATFKNHLSAFTSTLVRAATDSNSFNFSDLKKKKITVYLVVRPEDMSALGKLFGVILDRLVFSLTKGKVKQGEQGRVLFMCDEFPALGALNRIKKGAAFLGGYGVRMCIIYQNYAQLEDVYGAHGAREITGLMHERIHFASSDIDEAKKISAELGQRTVKGVSRSFNKLSTSKSVSEASKDLMSASNLMRLDEEKQIILAAGQRPILCNKIFYYKDKRFVSRLYPETKNIPSLQITKFLEKEKKIEVDTLKTTEETLDFA